MREKSDINKILIEKLITHPSERPFRGFIRNFILGIFIGSFLIIIKAFTKRLGGDEILSYLFCGILISFFGWGAERLWYSLIAVMFKKPFSFYAYLTRLPLWWMAGGIGYTIGILFMLKADYIVINDIPIKNVFFFGSTIGITFRGLMQFRVIQLIKEN